MTPASNQLIAKFRQLLDFYEHAVEARRDSCVKEFRGYALRVFDHLIKRAPTVRLRRQQVAPYIHPNGSLYWALYPRNLNVTLLDFARAHNLKVRAHHKKIQRHSKRPPLSYDAIPTIYDWRWTRKDFTARSVKCQWWEADLATAYEEAVVGRVRRARRVVAMARKSLAVAESVQEPLLDLEDAERWIRQKLGWADPAPDWGTAAWPRPTVEPQVPAASDNPFMARRLTAYALFRTAVARLQVCSDEYPAAAAEIRRRLSSHLAEPLPEPRLTLQFKTDDPVDDPILIWHGRRSQRHGLKPLPWSNRTALRRYQGYLARARAKGHDVMPRSQYLFVIQARRPQRDFSMAPPWERVFAHYYDTHVIAPLQKQWVALWELTWLVTAMPDPSGFVMNFDPDDYLPDAEARKEQQARDRKPWT